jgi:FtsP/CotA-like multicopper oxidase with cupredoxin domain
MGERYEIIMDFSGFKGQNITMMNGEQQSQIVEFGNTDKVMRFIVGSTTSDDSNNGDIPPTLSSSIDWPAHHDEVDKEFRFQQGGADSWTINGVSFSDPNSRVLARPPQGTVERWRLLHAGGAAVHPVHIHLVNMQVVARIGGRRGLLPYETAGLKDVVLLEPGETVEVLAVYGPWNGMYMFHCHNLVHEDHAMMAAFNTTLLAELGYEFNSSQDFSDPMDPRFVAKQYEASMSSDDARHGVVRMLGALKAYSQVEDLQHAEAAHYPEPGGSSMG